MKNDKIIHFV